MVKEMIQDVDKSTVIDSGVIDSPVLEKIPPIGLSGGIKTLILVKFEPVKVFNASTCGDHHLLDGISLSGLSLFRKKSKNI